MSDFYKRILENNPNAKILEIGNVLSHYTTVNHEIVDKYEKGINVKNIDQKRTI